MSTMIQRIPKSLRPESVFRLGRMPLQVVELREDEVKSGVKSWLSGKLSTVGKRAAAYTTLQQDLELGRLYILQEIIRMDEQDVYQIVELDSNVEVGKILSRLHPNLFLVSDRHGSPCLLTFSFNRTWGSDRGGDWSVASKRNKDAILCSGSRLFYTLPRKTICRLAKRTK